MDLYDSLFLRALVCQEHLPGAIARHLVPKFICGRKYLYSGLVSLRGNRACGARRNLSVPEWFPLEIHSSRLARTCHIKGGTGHFQFASEKTCFSSGVHECQRSAEEHPRIPAANGSLSQNEFSLCIKWVPHTHTHKKKLSVRSRFSRHPEFCDNLCIISYGQTH